MRQKTDKKYKELLKTFYNFKEIDFIEQDNKIYTNCKDNVMLSVRDVYEEEVRKSFEDNQLLLNYNSKRDLQPYDKKSCYCGHTTTCDCGNPSIYEFKANNKNNFNLCG